VARKAVLIVLANDQHDVDWVDVCRLAPPAQVVYTPWPKQAFL